MMEKLKNEQGRCPEIRLKLKDFSKIDTAKSKDKISSEVEAIKDYRVHPMEGILERKVIVSKVEMFVPVMPTTTIPPEFFGVKSEKLTWRRFAFERAHMTFLEPHRNSSASWQVLKRIAWWPKMRSDFE